MTKAPGRFWIIQHPSSTGAVVAKFDTPGETQIPDDVADYSGFNIIEVADRSSLASKTIDQSGLTADEKELLAQVYPVEGV